MYMVCPGAEKLVMEMLVGTLLFVFEFDGVLVGVKRPE